MANTSHCIARQKAGIKACKEKKLRKESGKEKEKTASIGSDDVGEIKTSPELEAEMDLETKN